MIKKFKGGLIVFIAGISIFALLNGCYEDENKSGKSKTDESLQQSLVEGGDSALVSKSYSSDCFSMAFKCNGYTDYQGPGQETDTDCSWTEYEPVGDQFCKDEICEETTYYYSEYDVFCYQDGVGYYFYGTCKELNESNTITYTNDTDCYDNVFDTPCDIPAEFNGGVEIECCL